MTLGLMWNGNAGPIQQGIYCKKRSIDSGGALRTRFNFINT